MLTGEMSLAGGSTSKRPKLFQPVICRAPVQAERTIPWARYPGEIGKSRDARTFSYLWVGGWGRRRPPPRMRVRKPLYPARTSRAINSRVIDRRCRDQHGETDRPDQRHRSLARSLARRKRRRSLEIRVVSRAKLRSRFRRGSVSFGIAVGPSLAGSLGRRLLYCCAPPLPISRRLTTAHVSYRQPTRHLPTSLRPRT